MSRSLDMRYGEQIFEVQVPLDGLDVAAAGRGKGSGLDTAAAGVVQQAVERFHRRHEELYAYSSPGQEVVIISARVAVTAELGAMPEAAARHRSSPRPLRERARVRGRAVIPSPWEGEGRRPATRGALRQAQGERSAIPSPWEGEGKGEAPALPHAGRRRVYLDGWADVPVYPLEGLPPDFATDGPAIFESAMTTVLANKTDRVSVTPHGWLDMRVAG